MKLRITFMLVTLLQVFMYFSSCDVADRPSVGIVNTGNLKLLLDISAIPTGAGTVTVSPNKDYYRPGDSVLLKAIPESSYYFDHWTGGLSGSLSDATLTIDSSTAVRAVFAKSEWTILVYMSADNDLEPQAINDINEMESIDLGGSGVKVLVLVDRANGYDSSNGAWTDTRLYEIGNDSGGNNSLISENTKQLASPELGLSTSEPTELDMGDPNTLKNFIRFAKNKYPATNYGLILWGHGSGWRAAKVTASSLAAQQSPEWAKLPVTQDLPGWLMKVSKRFSDTRATGFDDTDSDFLYTSELGDAVSVISESDPGEKWGFIGMDLCDGMTIEQAYQLRGSADYYIASEDLIPATGWSYNLLLSNVRTLSNRSPLSVSRAVFDAFVSAYGSLSGSTCSVVDLSKIDSLVGSWNEWSSALRDSIADSTTRDLVRNTLFSGTEDFYETPGDLNIDMYDAADKIAEVLSDRIAVVNASSAVENAINNSVVSNFAAANGNPRAKGIAIHLVRLDASGNIPNPPHEPAYVRGGTAAHPLAFVQSSDSTWVPSYSGNLSLLDRLFYEVF